MEDLILAFRGCFSISIFIYVKKLQLIMQKIKKPKLLLINPLSRHRKGLRMRLESTYPPVALAILAALTPKTWDIKLIDENFDDFVYEPADLVAFTSFTASAPRAYEISKVYRDKGIKTVFGGVHASVCTEEALNYFDVVVRCEAESVWEKLLEDFEKGTLQRIYEGERKDPVSYPMPRHDLFNKDYIFSSVSTTRGCPMNCEFCSVSVFSGNKHRLRSIEDILDELEVIKNKYIIFLDDNLIGYGKKGQERAISLFKGMIDRKIKKEWLCQVSLNVADNEEVLKWASKSGCKVMLIGIESEKTSALQDVNKALNVKMGTDSYKQVFKKIHKHGIGILGTFIFGLENDTIGDLKRRAEYTIKSSVDSIQTTMLTPLPGTVLYDRLNKQNSIFKTNYPEDWAKYHMLEPVYKPNYIDPDEFAKEMYYIWAKIYNRRTALKQLVRTIWNTKSVNVGFWCYYSNYNYYNFCFEKEISKGVKAFIPWLKSFKKVPKYEDRFK